MKLAHAISEPIGDLSMGEPFEEVELHRAAMRLGQLVERPIDRASLLPGERVLERARDGAFRCGFYDPPYEAPYKRAVMELARVCRERIAILQEAARRAAAGTLVASLQPGRLSSEK